MIKHNTTPAMENNGEIQSDITNLELYSPTAPFRLPLRIKDFDNEKLLTRFVKNCERLIRNSYEYRLWKNYIIDVLNINNCAITEESGEELTIELHHHIPSLFTFVKTIIIEHIENEREFSTFDICLKAIELHFQNRLGYVTLIKSMHEKFHKGFLDIPIDLVRGNYNYFLEEYKDYIPDEDMEIINSRLAVNTSNCSWSKNNYPITNTG